MKSILLASGEENRKKRKGVMEGPKIYLLYTGCAVVLVRHFP